MFHQLSIKQEQAPVWHFCTWFLFYYCPSGGGARPYYHGHHSSISMTGKAGITMACNAGNVGVFEVLCQTGL